MSKDLHTEYNAMLREDLPDLWDRISAALSDKNSMVSAEDEYSALPENSTATDSYRTQSESGSRKRSRTRIYRFAGLAAAACVCAAIVIPMAIIRANKTGSTSGARYALTQEYTETAEAETRSSFPEETAKSTSAITEPVRTQSAAGGYDTGETDAENTASLESAAISSSSPGSEAEETAADNTVSLGSAATGSSSPEAEVEETAADNTASLGSAATGSSSPEAESGTGAAVEAGTGAVAEAGTGAVAEAGTGAAVVASDGPVYIGVSVEIIAVYQEGSSMFRYLGRIQWPYEDAGLAVDDQITLIADDTTDPEVFGSLAPNCLYGLDLREMTDEQGSLLYHIEQWTDNN